VVLKLRAEIFDAVEKEAGWNGVSEPEVLAVMMAESGGNPGAIGDSGHSIGLWQLHDAGAGAHMTDDDRLSIARSTAVAIDWLAQLVEQCGGWQGAWSAYNQGYAGWLQRGTEFNQAYVDAVWGLAERIRAEDFSRVEDLEVWAKWA